MLTFGIEDKVAVLRLDDGKANAVGHQFIDSMNEGLDRAQKEASSVVILGLSLIHIRRCRRRG